MLTSLQSTALANQFKPAILQCFGDIAGAIGGHFETYLSVVAQVLQQAAGVSATPDGSYEMFDYVVSLREGIMDAWGGIINAMKAGGKSTCLILSSQNSTNSFQPLFFNHMSSQSSPS
jgi:importin subunit beta-1